MSGINSSNDLSGKNIVLINEPKPAMNNMVKSNNINQDNNAEQDIESNISQIDTLDESVYETLKRDFVMMLHKLEQVLIPKTTIDNSKQLRNWDLWGPLLLCIILSMIVSIGGQDAGTALIVIFVIVWFGGLVVTLNSQFLGANISVFQSICVLGYCVFPIDIAALLIKLFYFMPIIIKIIFALGAMMWSTSIGFMSQLVEPKKKLLAAYPIFLFYLFLSWFILAN